MPSFRYRALSAAGETRQGLVEARDLDAALDRMHEMGLTPLRLDTGATAETRAAGSRLFRRRVSSRDLIVFTRQLETMLESGLPLLAALEILHDQATHSEFKSAVDRVRSDVEQGSTLAESLRRHPRCFPSIYVSLVHAGEEGGMIGPMLERMASLLEYEAETEQRIRSATFYPTLILVELALAFFVLLKVVLPRFASLFRNFHAELPLPTRILIGLSDFLEQRWLLVLLGLAAGVTAALLWWRTESGRNRVDRITVTAPIFGPIFLKTIMSRFARILAALIASGIPIIQALDISKRVLGNRVVEAEIEKMREGVVAGMGLAEPLRGSAIVPPVVVKMIAVGEETGALDKMLLRVSRYYDQDVDYAVKNLSAAIEPVLLVVLGAGVLFTALAVFLPLWNLMNVFRH